MATNKDSNKDVKDKAAEAANAAAERGAEAAEEATANVEEYLSQSIDTLQKLANDYYEKLSGLTGDAAQHAGKYYEDSQEYVREHPGGSLLGAFAFGVLLGVLIRR